MAKTNEELKSEIEELKIREELECELNELKRRQEERRRRKQRMSFDPDSSGFGH